jgi:hypothetical protein
LQWVIVGSGKKKGRAISSPAFLIDRRGTPEYEHHSGAALVHTRENLYGLHVSCCRAFLTLLNVEADTLAFVERLKALALNGGVVNEQIATTILLDEPEAFALVKPFYFAF